MTRLSDSDIRAITDYLLVRTRLEPADLCFVFGSRRGEAVFPAEIARMWREKLFSRILISGGLTPGGHAPEAAIIKDLVVSQGVPEDSILLETRATNSGQNVQFALPIIDKVMGLGNIRSIIAVGQLQTSRRYLMTLERYWPGPVRKMLAPVATYPVTRDAWQCDLEFRAVMLAEWARIGPYLAEGLIAELTPETCPLLAPRIWSAPVVDANGYGGPGFGAFAEKMK
ncbi:YdcF family protein [Amaricoccus macauensis]|uniref:YdcF family protein n=1 Tax=Amaricoccus macauensis TaxID=57001 RepID=UPI003C7C00C1